MVCHDEASPCYLYFDRDLCRGCSRCVKVCPTRAIRVKNDKAVMIHSRCTGCGSCMQVCPAGAVKAATASLESVRDDNISVALVSPILYSQFPGVLPQDILLGLKQLGFTHTVDMSYFFEMFQWATEEYIIRNRSTSESPWPLISTVCPVVNRLITTRFPGLIPHAHPVIRPVALMAREVGKQFGNHYGIPTEEISLYYINPCATKLGYGRKEGDEDPFDHPNTTFALGINDIYGPLVREVDKIRNSDSVLTAFSGYEFEQCNSGDGLLWAMSGGEIAATGVEKSLAVSGLSETISFLEKIEMGLFRDIEYIEFRACPEGCIGGSLTAIDKYLAKSAAAKMVKTLGTGKRLSRERMIRLYNKNWFFTEKRPHEMQAACDSGQKPLTLDDFREIERLVALISGKDCSACGAPDCRTFAEDVVRGYSRLDECLLLNVRRMKKRLEAGKEAGIAPDVPGDAG